MRMRDWSSDVGSSDLIEGEVVVRSAILAAEAVAKEEVEPGEGGMRGGPDILAKRDDRRQPHGTAGAVDFPLIFRDDIDTFPERGLDGGLPGTPAQGIIADRRVIGVQPTRGPAYGMQDQAGVV